MVAGRLRNPFPKKKSRLSPLGKTAVAARVVLDAMDGKIDEKEARARLCAEVGLNWSLITALQYLSGQEAIASLRQLPADWQQDGLTRLELAKAIFLAGHAVGHALPDGRRLCASYLAQDLKAMDLEGLIQDQKSLTQHSDPDR